MSVLTFKRRGRTDKERRLRMIDQSITRNIEIMLALKNKFASLKVKDCCF